MPRAAALIAACVFVAAEFESRLLERLLCSNLRPLLLAAVSFATAGIFGSSGASRDISTDFPANMLYVSTREFPPEEDTSVSCGA